MIGQEKITLTFTIPLYLHEEISCRAKPAKHGHASELLVRLEESLSMYPCISESFGEVQKLKYLLSSKDFVKKSKVVMSANLHQKLKCASADAGHSMSVDLAFRIQKIYRDQ